MKISINLLHPQTATADGTSGPGTVRTTMYFLDFHNFLTNSYIFFDFTEELAQFTYKLYSCYNPRFGGRVFAYDIISLAFIMVALKLLFILDDKVEHILSERAQRLRHMVPSGKGTFFTHRVAISCYFG